MQSYNVGTTGKYVRITVPGGWSATTRFGIAVSSEMMKFYTNNTEIATYRFDADPIVTGATLKNKVLGMSVTGWNNLDGGILTCYFDPSLWTTNSAGYTIPLGAPSTYDEFLKKLKQY